MPNYIVIEDFTAPKKEKEGDGNRLQRQFKKGEFISGKADGYATMKGSKVHIIKEDSGFVIPAKNLKQIKSDFMNDSGEAAKQMNLEVNKIINKNFFQKTIQNTKRSAQGLVIGVFGGFAYGLFTHRSLLWCGFFGGIAGGLTGVAINKFINKKEFSTTIKNENNG